MRLQVFEFIRAGFSAQDDIAMRKPAELGYDVPMGYRIAQVALDGRKSSSGGKLLK